MSMFIGEALAGDGNEIAHIDLIIGSKSGHAGSAFCNALANNKDGFTTLLAVVTPNLPAKPDTIMFNKVTIKGAKQAVQMFGPAQRAVAMAVADSVEDGTIPAAEADNLFISVGVFIEVMRWEKKRCLADSKAERAADLACALSVPRSPVTLAACRAASELSWRRARATPKAAVAPISGAPRTCMSRIAAAAASRLSRCTKVSRQGSRVWSRMTI